jgi:shikimate kinase
MNIVLIGMRGSGKTMVGKILARKLGRELVEMDEMITRRAGLTIPEIVERYGWGKFRDIEEEVTEQVAKLGNIINASGGGVVTIEKNIQRLRKSGVLVWLKASVDTLFERIGEDSERPPLERISLYQKAADFVVDTENKTPEEVAEAIINLLTKRGVTSD